MSESRDSSAAELAERTQLSLGGGYDLMKRRIGEILLVSSLYDSFILEEDGHLGDRILADFVDLHLRYAPRVTRVSTAKKALALMRHRRFDLVLTMMRLPDMDVFDLCRKVKRRYLGTPVVVLAYESVELSQLLEDVDPSVVDHVLVWSGDSRLLLATIKLIEDAWNVDHDTRQGRVRTVLLVEDSVRRLSSFLPMVYAEMMTQTRNVMAEGLNYVDKLLRMRTRPKILLARDFDEAAEIFNRYERNMMAVISDVRFPRDGKLDPRAGVDLVRSIRDRRPAVRAVLHSSDSANRDAAHDVGAFFLDKNSLTWLQDLSGFFVDHLGFGDFIFRNGPAEPEVDRACNIREMEEKILTIPDESVTFHLTRHHLSTWLQARGEYAMADRLRMHSLEEFTDLVGARQLVAAELRELRAARRRGVISDFHATDVDPASPFVRIASGSLGGKGRGIAFMAALLARLQLDRKFDGVRITVPQTAVIGTDAFTQFLESNKLEKTAIELEDDEAIGRVFRAAALPAELETDLRALLGKVRFPLAVRSSSLLEDSLFQPFAGLYSTYMIPNNHPDIEVRLRQLTDAIKLVYASTFFQAPKSYIRSTPFRVEEEKMAVVIQRLAAKRHDDVCYPNFAGVAQSHNFYPVGRLKAEEGLAHVALGLGKTVVEGGSELRFSPARPGILPQFGTTTDVMRNSQREFYALDLSNPYVRIRPGGEGPLVRLDLQRAERDQTLHPIGSVFVKGDGVLRDGLYHDGPRYVTFAHVLKSELFPMAAILEKLLDVCRRSMGSEVEIEFAVNLFPPEQDVHEFAVVQCRPLATTGERGAVTLDSVERSEALCWTDQALGNGAVDDITDVVYVGPDRWDAAKTVEIAREVGEVNAQLETEGRRSILVGIGRWGTADHWLGIPVNWNEISSAKVMVECGTAEFSVEPSQGSHFFHNLTSFQIGYLTVQPGQADAVMDWSRLAAAPLVRELKYVRHVRFAAPLRVLLDGRKGRGAILMPDED
ncbi:MAG: hypothetical protein CMJ87_13360 [Planctomycetes bacterium]|nr:hypothetical protein [Planctomycetota bacterium]